MRVDRDWRVRWRMPSEPRARRRVIWAGVIVAAVVLWWINFVVSYATEDILEARNAFAFIFVFRAMVSIGLLALAYRLVVSAVGPRALPDSAPPAAEPEQRRHPAFEPPEDEQPPRRDPL